MTYQDTYWLDTIPKHWGVKRIKDVFTLASGLSISKADLLEDGVPVISYGQIHAKFNTGAKIDDRLIRYISPAFLSSDKSSLVSEGDFIFADTSEDIEGCGNCVYIDRDFPLFAGYHTVILRNIDQEKHPFLAYLFQSDDWRSQIRSKVCGVKLFSITKGILNGVNVVLPPHDEQIKIVSYLNEKVSLINKSIDVKEKELNKLRVFRQSKIDEVVTMGLHHGTSMKDSGVDWLGKVPSHWVIGRIGSYFEERREQVSDTDFPPLSVTKQGIFPQIEGVAKTGNGENRKKVCVDDFVINSRSDRKGSSGVSKYDGSVSLINIVLCSNKSILPSFCNYLFKSHKFIEEYYRVGHGIVADLWTTGYNDMRTINIAIPPFEEQIEITQYLNLECEKIDQKYALIEQQIEKLQLLKRALINEVVTGKRQLA